MKHKYSIIRFDGEQGTKYVELDQGFIKKFHDEFDIACLSDCDSAEAFMSGPHLDTRYTVEEVVISLKPKKKPAKSPLDVAEAAEAAKYFELNNRRRRRV